MTSQFEEDRVLADIFTRLGIVCGSCVEFGAWDGKKNSNTYNLIVNRGWRGVLIEANTERFKDLIDTYHDRPDITKINRIVGFDPPDTLDSILSETNIQTDFDLLSIDIDGNDYHVWAALKKYSPKVVVIEFNPSMPNEFLFVQARDLGVNHGSSIRAITELGRDKGYELVATTECNSLYVRRELFSCLGVKDNSLLALHPSIRRQTHIVQLYDGTLMVIGTNRLLWREPPIRIEVPQALPEHLRKFPDALDINTLPGGKK